MVKAKQLLSKVNSVHLATVILLGTMTVLLVHLIPMIDSVKATSDDLHKIVVADNQVLFDKNGVVDEARKTLLDAHRGLGQGAVIERDYYQKILEPQTKQLFGDLHEAIKGLNAPQVGADLHGTFLNLNASLQELPPLIQDTDTLLKTLNQMGLDIDQNLIKDPDIQNSLKQIAGILTQVNLTMEDVKAVADKVKANFTGPTTKKQKILAILEMLYKTALIKVALGK